MRLLALALFALVALSAIAAEPAEPIKPAYPLWDGQETIAEYAKRTKLEPTKTIDLGGGVKLELVLIPVGKFIMGTKEPKPVDEQHLITQIAVGVAALTISVGVLLVMLGFVVVRAEREKHRPQVSLARLVVLAAIAGVGLLGGLHWFYTKRAFAQAQREYQVALGPPKIPYDWEKPTHEVTLSTPYYMGKFEVTQEQYQQVMGTKPSKFKGRHLPVVTVSRDDAQEFCKQASAKIGSTVRLPSEAEWEYACRAGTRTTYCTGDSEADLELVGWYDKNSKTAHPVGQKVPNAWGLYDMHGNVWEWCEDWFATYKAEATVDPQGPEQVSAEAGWRVLRGGSWGNYACFCRSAYRRRDYPVSRGVDVGFRVVVAIPKTP